MTTELQRQIIQLTIPYSTFIHSGVDGAWINGSTPAAVACALTELVGQYRRHILRQYNAVYEGGRFIRERWQGHGARCANLVVWHVVLYYFKVLFVSGLGEWSERSWRLTLHGGYEAVLRCCPLPHSFSESYRQHGPGLRGGETWFDGIHRVGPVVPD